MDPNGIYDADPNASSPHSSTAQNNFQADASGSENTPRQSRATTSRWNRRQRGSSVLITDARESPGQDRHRREVVYTILQLIRVPALLLSIYLAYVHSAWLIAALVTGVTFPLPWIAVVIANAKGKPKDKRERNTYKPALARQYYQQQADALAAAQGIRSLEQREGVTVDESGNFVSPSGPNTVPNDKDPNRFGNPRSGATERWEQVEKLQKTYRQANADRLKKKPPEQSNSEDDFAREPTQSNDQHPRFNRGSREGGLFT